MMKAKIMKAARVEIEAARAEIEFKVAFSIEEKECEGFGLCYGCKKPGHLRRNCPNESNREGFQKRLLGVCFNCGGDHRWNVCTQELKPSLKARKEQLMQRGLFNTGKYAGNSNNHAGNNRMNNYQNSRNVQPNNELKELKDLLLQVVNKKVTPPVSYGQRSANVSADAMVTINVDGISPEGKTIVEKRYQEEDLVEVKTTKGWVKVVGKADTGADTSCGSMPNHGHLCDKIWEICGNMRVRVADGTTHPIKHKGLMEVRLNGKEIGTVEVLLIDLKDWTPLLLGRDLLIKKGLYKE